MQYTSLRMREMVRGYMYAAGGVFVATALFWLGRGALDKGQASLLYLPVVIACAVRFGFGPAVVGAMLSFACWNFFFLPPFGTFVVADPKDWLSLGVFLLAAVTTARLASQARAEAQEARAREAEIGTLLMASESLSGEMRAAGVLAVLIGQIRTLCRASECAVLRPADLTNAGTYPLARAALEHGQPIGFGDTPHLWAKAMDTDTHDHAVYVPLRAGGQAVGVLRVGPRTDGLAFSASQERLIVTLAHHAAVAIARDALAEQAAQAAALRETDALKDALLSLVSHELRTPLAAIKASASGLQQPHSVWSGAARAEAMRSIDREADRLSALVSNLLDLSRLEAGAWHPCREWCDLPEVVGTALDRLAPADAARVRVVVPPNLPPVQADYVQVALVLTNLLENAVKYAPSDAPIDLTLSSANAPRPAVRVDVRDWGAGLLAGEENVLFDKFYRSATHAKSTTHGTGLGLALCRAIVDAHGGRIWAASVPAGEGTGAVFSFLLPIE